MGLGADRGGHKESALPDRRGGEALDGARRVQHGPQLGCRVQDARVESGAQPQPVIRISVRESVSRTRGSAKSSTTTVGSISTASHRRVSAAAGKICDTFSALMANSATRHSRWGEEPPGERSDNELASGSVR